MGQGKKQATVDKLGVRGLMKSLEDAERCHVCSGLLGGTIEEEEQGRGVEGAPAMLAIPLCWSATGNCPFLNMVRAFARCGKSGAIWARARGTNP